MYPITPFPTTPQRRLPVIGRWLLLCVLGFYIGIGAAFASVMNDNANPVSRVMGLQHSETRSGHHAVAGCAAGRTLSDPSVARTADCPPRQPCERCVQGAAPQILAPHHIPTQRHASARQVSPAAALHDGRNVSPPTPPPKSPSQTSALA